MRPSILPSSKKIGWPGLRRGEDFGKRAGDVRNIAMPRRAGVFSLLGQDQQIARVQANRLLDEGKIADVTRGDFLAVARTATIRRG